MVERAEGKGKGKQALIGAQPRRCLPDYLRCRHHDRQMVPRRRNRGKERLDFPVDIIKIGGSVGREREANKRFAWTFDPGAEPRRHQHILDYVDTGEGDREGQRSG